MSVAIALLGLALLILVHEAGHFFVARAVGMSPRKFYLGFPPAVARVRRRGIEYGIGAIPLGGYVKIPGMHRPAPIDADRYFARAENEDPQLIGRVGDLKRLFAGGEFERASPRLDELESDLRERRLSPAAARDAERGIRELRDAIGADAYWRQATWKKIAVIFAGPATNIVVAVALFAAVFMLGIPAGATTTVGALDDGSPARAAGIRTGDRVVAVGGEPTPTFEDIRARVQASRGRPVTVTVERGGERRELGPTRPQRRDGRYVLGIRPEPAYYERYPVGESVALAGETTWDVTKLMGQALGRVVTGEGRKEVSSVVGITQASSQAVEQGVRRYLQVLALISLSLALLNLLPLLPLDGGHITFSVIEGIRGRALGREVYERVSIVGIALVLFLFAIGLSNDISRNV